MSKTIKPDVPEEVSLLLSSILDQIESPLKSKSKTTNGRKSKRKIPTQAVQSTDNTLKSLPLGGHRRKKTMSKARSKTYSTIASGELEAHPETMEFVGPTFRSQTEEMSDLNHAGHIPSFHGTMSYTIYSSKKSIRVKLVGIESQALAAIECGGTDSNLYRDLDQKGKMDLLRAAANFYKSHFDNGSKIIYPIGSKVECADWGRYWTGSIVASAITESGDLYYKMSFDKTKDTAFHIAHRVRLVEKTASIPTQVRDDTLKMKMVGRLENLTSDRTLAGHICQIDICESASTGQPRDCLIEMIDVSTHKAYLYDLQLKTMFERPLWTILKYDSINSRKIPPIPTAFTTTGTAPFEGGSVLSPSPPKIDHSKVAEVISAAGAMAESKAKSKKKPKPSEDEQPLVTQQQREWITLTIEEAISKILTQLVAHYDGRSGNILTEVQNIRDELDSLKKEVAQLKGSTEGQTSSLMDTLKGCVVMASELTSATKNLMGGEKEENGGSFHNIGNRLLELENKMATLDVIRDDNREIKEMLGSVLGILQQSQSQQGFQQPFFQGQQPALPMQNMINQQYPPMQMMPMVPQPQYSSYQQPQYQQLQPVGVRHIDQAQPLAETGDIEDLLRVLDDGQNQTNAAVRGNTNADEKGIGEIMKKLKEYEDPQQKSASAMDTKVVRIGDEYDDDTRHSTLSNADRAIEVVNRIMENTGQKGGLGGTTFRRIVSFDSASKDQSVEVTTFQESHFKETGCIVKKLNEGIITEYGVMKPKEDGSGTVLVGISLDNIPEPLLRKMVRLVKQIGARQSRDSSYVAYIISSCLREFFSEIKVLAKALPLSLLEKPVYYYEQNAPEGALNNLFSRNVEPLKSILKFLRQRLVMVDELQLVRCFRQSLKEMQKAYRAHNACKHVRKTSSCSSTSDTDIPKPPASKRGRQPLASTKQPSPARGRRQTRTPLSTENQHQPKETATDDPPTNAALLDAMAKMTEEEKRKWLESLGDDD